jgi:hypothetical protein
MNERDWADRFSHKVDTLLREARRTDDEPAPAAYRQALDLARVLATTDFSDESEGRAAVRRRLLNRVGVQERKPRAFPRRLVLLVPALVLAALLLVAAAWPGVLEHFLQSLQLGPHTSAHQVDPGNLSWSTEQAATAHPQVSGPMTLEVVQREDGWTIRTLIGNFGGSVPPGETAIVLRVDSVDQVQAAVSFDLQQPGYLPAGYQFREAMVAPGESGFLFYDGPQGEIVLVQTPVYVRVEEYPGGKAVSTSVMVSVLTDKPMEEVVMGGWQAGWFEGNSLVWEADGISYTLGGVNLSLEDAVRIAESLG